MKLFEMRIPKYCLVGLLAIAVLVGFTFAAAASTPIWSNQTTSNVSQKPWSGTVVLTNNATNAVTGDTIALTASLNPLPTIYQSQQNVTFWYSASPITVDGNGNPLNPGQLILIPGSNTNMGVITIAGIAHLTMTAMATGSFYFIAEVQNPT